MKKILAVALLLMSASVFAQTKTEQSVLNLSKKKFQWLIEKQYDSLDLLLDDKLEYVHSNGWVQSKAEVIADSKSGSMVYQNVDVKEAHARAYNNETVIVTGTGTCSGIH